MLVVAIARAEQDAAVLNAALVFLRAIFRNAGAIIAPIKPPLTPPAPAPASAPRSDPRRSAEAGNGDFTWAMANNAAKGRADAANDRGALAQALSGFGSAAELGARRHVAVVFLARVADISTLMSSDCAVLGSQFLVSASALFGTVKPVP